MLVALRQEVDGFAGDFEAGCSPLAPMQDIDLDALPRLDERSCELVVFTSGSTGTPLAIVKRRDQLAREVEAHEQIFGHLLANARIHGTVSHQHIYGLLFRVLSPLAAGRCIEPRRFFHEELFQALGSGPSILVATPAYLQRLPEPSGQRPPDGPVRMVFSSGGVLSEETAARVRRAYLEWLRLKSMAAVKPAVSPGDGARLGHQLGSRFRRSVGASRRSALAWLPRICRHPPGCGRQIECKPCPTGNSSCLDGLIASSRWPSDACR